VTDTRDVVLVETPAPLPQAEHQTPACGACRGETNCYDRDEFTCDDCGLTFVGEDLVPEFTDSEAKPCLHPCTNTWHGSRDLGSYECHPCALPAGHPTKFHWTGCRPRKEARS
jgi:hypothetical protein